MLLQLPSTVTNASSKSHGDRLSHAPCHCVTSPSLPLILIHGGGVVCFPVYYYYYHYYHYYYHCAIINRPDTRAGSDYCEFVDALAAISPRPATIVPYQFARTGLECLSLLILRVAL